MARTAVEETLASYGVDCTGAMTCTINAADTCGSATCVSVELDYNWGDEPLVPGLPGLGLVTPDHLVCRAVAQVS